MINDDAPKNQCGFTSITHYVLLLPLPQSFYEECADRHPGEERVFVCVSQTTAGTCEPEQGQTPAFARMTNSGRYRGLLLAGEREED